MRNQTVMLIPLLALGACSEKAPDPRGVGHDETLLSVSATGRSETRPDEARFTAGVSTIAASAEAATQKNNETMTRVTEALKAFGVAGKGPPDPATHREPDRLGRQQGQVRGGEPGRGADTRGRQGGRSRRRDDAGRRQRPVGTDAARLRSGSRDQIGLHAAAYRAARARADAYAGAAGLKIKRVLAIRDGGDNAPPMPYYEMDAAANRAVAQVGRPAPSTLGVSESQVSVRVDFALSEK